MEGTTDQNNFHVFVEEVARKLRLDPSNRDKRIVIQIDNARPHESPAIAEAITQLGVSVVFNARYSPQLNSIEMLWHECKRRLKKCPPVSEK